MSDKPEKNIVLIPSSIFKNRDLSVLESLIQFLSVTEELSIKEIAHLLNRDQRTVWTVLNRIKKKQQ